MDALDKPNEATKKDDEILVKFKTNSTLEQFLLQKTGNKEKFTFKQILIALKNVIRSEELYDPRNPSVVLCSQELERTLNMRALHVSELPNLVISQIENTEEIKYPGYLIFKNSHSNQTKRFYGNPNVKFGLQPDFMAILRTVEGCDQTKTIFSYKEILELLSRYICSKRETIVDPRNVKMALVENDPLGKVFKVKAFHRCQVLTLLDQQLVCTSLRCQAAWTVARCLQNAEKIKLLDVPREVKSTLIMMMTAE